MKQEEDGKQKDSISQPTSMYGRFNSPGTYVSSTSPLLGEIVINPEFKDFYGFSKKNGENFIPFYSPRHTRYKHIPLFEQPITSPNFSELLESQKVSLEIAGILHHRVLGKVQTITPANDEECGVVVRYTTDEWNTHIDIEATRMNTQSVHEAIYINTLKTKTLTPYEFFIDIEGQCCALLQFAILYWIKDVHHWDNRSGKNYTISI